MIETEHVSYRDGDTALTGFLALDRYPGPRPGILVVQGGAGVDDHARGRALRLAEWGFVVFAGGDRSSQSGLRQRVYDFGVSISFGANPRRKGPIGCWS